MPLSPEDWLDAQAELARIDRTLTRLYAASDRDETREVALELRALELLRRLDDGELEHPPIREDGFYGSGL